MRDDDDGAVEAGHEPLEAREAGEVEIVRRLVEQQDVGVAEQDRRERRPSRLSAGKRRGRAVEIRAQPQLAEGLLRTQLEVAAAAGEELVERRAVLAGERRIRFEPRGELVHATFRLGDSGAAREVAAQRLAGPRVSLLRQQGDRDAGCAVDRAPVRRVEAGEQTQERRLARTVRPDEPDARPRRNDEVDVRENDMGTVSFRDAGCGEQG